MAEKGLETKPARRVYIQYDDLDELAACVHPDNPKGHSLGAIESSFERFGYTGPVIRNDRDGRIASGHGRLEVLLALKAQGAEPPDGIHLGPNGEWLVPTIRGIDLSPEDARAFLVADNRTGELGGWDEQRLAKLLSELANSESGLDGIGFSEVDLADLLGSLDFPSPDSDSDPDQFPQELTQDQVYVRPGQMWHLGPHRILCGDATRADDVGRLLGGRKADLAVTDPPYNVDYGHHGGAGRNHRHRPLANDALAAADWEEFVRQWARQLLSAVDGALYICMSCQEWPTVSRILAEEGGHWSTTVIWAKDRFVLGRSDYQRQYEPVWYGWPEGKKHCWCGDRDQGDIWSIPRPAASELHPTMKPVELIERMIANSSRPGERVLDLFVGSGTTIIAAERLGRRCLGIELEPRYVQVSIERWERYTGRKAELAE